MLWRTNLLALFIAGYVCFLAVIEVGFRLGRRRREGSNDATITHVGALQTALLGLLALLLGFTFAMAVTRFEKRKALVVEEANAIGTTFLRSRFLPEPRRQTVARLLRDYVAARIASHNERSEGARIAADATGARIQQELLVAYGSGLTGQRRFVLHAVFALLLVLVLTTILDLDRPRRGLIKVSQASMIRLKATLDQ